MKKIAVITALLSLLLVLCACGYTGGSSESSDASKGQETAQEEKENTGASTDTEKEDAEDTEQADEQEETEAVIADLDFNRLNPTDTKAQVESLINDPSVSLGKVFKITGETKSATDSNGSPYYTIVIPELKDEYPYGIEYALANSGAYPKDGETATITGTFEKCDVGDGSVYRINNATIKIEKENVQENEVIQDSLEPVSES